MTLDLTKKLLAAHGNLASKLQADVPAMNDLTLLVNTIEVLSNSLNLINQHNGDHDFLNNEGSEFIMSGCVKFPFGFKCHTDAVIDAKPTKILVNGLQIPLISKFSMTLGMIGTKYPQLLLRVICKGLCRDESIDVYTLVFEKTFSESLEEIFSNDSYYMHIPFDRMRLSGSLIPTDEISILIRELVQNRLKETR